MTSWQSLIGTVAPVLGTALGGPLGGVATTFICNALGLKSDSNDSDIQAALVGNPDNLVKMKQAELDFQARMEQLNVDIDKINADDRDSARKREVDSKDNTPKLLAFLVTIGFFGILAWMMSNTVPAGSAQVLDVIVGALATGWVQVMSYYFGSSAGSDKKSDLLAKSTLN